MSYSRYRGASHGTAISASTSTGAAETNHDTANALLAYANASVCRETSNASPALSLSSHSSSHSQQQSRSASPKFNIADFESSVQIPALARAGSSSRETSYASNANIDDLDFARSSGSNTPANINATNIGARAGGYARNINTSFLKRSASKLLPRAIATANLPTPPNSQPNSALPSPTKSLSSFITGNTFTGRDSISSSASRASVRAKTASKVLFDNYFNGDSNNVLQPYHSSNNTHSRSNSVASTAGVRAEEYGLDYEQEDHYDGDMASPTYYTRAPERTRPRRSPTMESTASTYAGKLGSWFSKQSSPKSASHPCTSDTAQAQAQALQDDPLLSLDIHSTLFPYGAVDPLNPTSFNDLLAAAEAVISTYQNAYKSRVVELAQIKAEASLKQEEIEECETRARHLKSQLREMGEQCTAQTRRAEGLEQVLREKEEAEAARPTTASSCDFDESSETLVREGRKRHHAHAGSDSGFESDEDSVFSHTISTPAKAAVKDSEFRPMTAPSRPQFSNDLRTENEMLRQRVMELEGAVESCLDMISNPLAL